MRVCLRYDSHDPPVMWWTLHASKTGPVIFWGPLGSYKRRDLDRFILIIFGLCTGDGCVRTDGDWKKKKEEHYKIHWGATVPLNEAYTIIIIVITITIIKLISTTSSCACVKRDVFVLVNIMSRDWRIMLSDGVVVVDADRSDHCTGSKILYIICITLYNIIIIILGIIFERRARMLTAGWTGS